MNWPGRRSKCFVVTAVPDEKKGERLVVLHTVTPEELAPVLEKLGRAGLPNLWLPRANQYLPNRRVAQPRHRQTRPSKNPRTRRRAFQKTTTLSVRRRPRTRPRRLRDLKRLLTQLHEERQPRVVGLPGRRSSYDFPSIFWQPSSPGHPQIGRDSEVAQAGVRLCASATEGRCNMGCQAVPGRHKPARCECLPKTPSPESANTSSDHSENHSRAIASRPSAPSSCRTAPDRRTISPPSPYSNSSSPTHP